MARDIELTLRFRGIEISELIKDHIACLKEAAKEEVRYDKGY